MSVNEAHKQILEGRQHIVQAPVADVVEGLEGMHPDKLKKLVDEASELVEVVQGKVPFLERKVRAVYEQASAASALFLKGTAEATTSGSLDSGAFFMIDAATTMSNHASKAQTRSFDLMHHLSVALNHLNSAQIAVVNYERTLGAIEKSTDQTAKAQQATLDQTDEYVKRFED